MKATLLVRSRIVYSQEAFAELVLWLLPQPLEGSRHPYKYRLAYVVRGHCVVRYDNEAGKGDHLHCADLESFYRFSTPDRRINDFQKQIERWNNENPDA